MRWWARASLVVVAAGALTVWATVVAGQTPTGPAQSRPLESVESGWRTAAQGSSLVALIGASFSLCAAMTGLWLTGRWKRRDDLNKLLEDIDVALSSRVYWLQRVTWSYGPPRGEQRHYSPEQLSAVRSEAWKRYRETIHHWNERLGWYYVQIHRLHGHRLARTIHNPRGDRKAQSLTVHGRLHHSHRALIRYVELDAPSDRRYKALEARYRALENHLQDWRDLVAYKSTSWFRARWRRLRYGRQAHGRRRGWWPRTVRRLLRRS